MGYDFDTVIERRGTGSAKWDMVEEGALPMWVADMDFAAPPEIVQALADRVGHAVFGYGFPTDELREAHCRWQERRNGWRPGTDETVVSPGVVPSIKAAIEACTELGDTVVVQPPVYFPFFSSVEQAGREVALNPLRRSEHGYGIDFDQLEGLFKAGARLLLLCSPHNPVGRVWSEAELTTLSELCVRYEVTVISDEIHGDIVYSGNRFVPLAKLGDDIAELTICCTSPSKSFNIAGNAVSFCSVANGELRGKLKNGLQRFGLDHPGVLEMEASRAAYEHGERWLDELLAYLEGNIARVNSFVDGRHGLVSAVPIEGTYIQWLDFSAFLDAAGLDDDGLKRRLQDEAKVVLSPGPLFGSGGSGYQRLNFATPRELLDEGLSRIGSVLDSI